MHFGNSPALGRSEFLRVYPLVILFPMRAKKSGGASLLRDSADLGPSTLVLGPLACHICSRFG
jgi:hypothetical protein